MQFHQRTGNVQPQTTAFCRTGAVPTDKTFHQFVRVDVQLIPGDVLHRDKYQIRILFDLYINAGIGLGIFAGVTQQIAQHTPHEVAVHQTINDFVFRCVDNSFQLGGRQFFFIFPHSLLYQFHNVCACQRTMDVASGCFGGFHQVFRQFFQTAGLAVQHFDINGSLSGQFFFFQQIHIVDDGCQWCFDVVGYVGDELCPQTFTLHFLIQGNGNAFGDIVQIFPVLAEGTEHTACIYLIFQIAGGKLFACPA